jgi:hypothetical protein
MAKNYIDNLSEEPRKGMLEKAEQGIWPSYAPLGYRNVVASNGKKTTEPDPDVALVIERLFEWYSSRDAAIRCQARTVEPALTPPVPPPSRCGGGTSRASESDRGASAACSGGFRLRVYRQASLARSAAAFAWSIAAISVACSQRWLHGWLLVPQ